MKKQQNLSLAALIYVLGVIVSLEFGIWSMVTAYSGRSCLGSEKQALLQFKKGLRDKYNYLSSWVGDDCCGWHGIACNNQSTSHVVKLDLRNCLLKGRIPTGNQLQTLDNPSIYAGNNQLCGQPILKPCASDSESHDVHDYSETDSDSNDGRVWFYAGLGPGLLVGFLGLCASLHFIKSWRYLYFQFVEKVFDKIAVDVALLRRKLHN